MDVKQFTLEAGFETRWDEKTQSVQYFPRISLNDGRGTWVLWTAKDPYKNHQHAMWDAEERLYSRLSDLMKDEE